ncbi:hypothetical protein Pmani_020689 [Petrolisthes manimaculis]|uniref:Matrix-remodeling-associated protein 7 helical domain-containing protein n=1 Tax=Petrolisthes manimaculis TaxID=1843537 RepID=A0AAE1PHX2_9EUCA|nr:hypothetical protein Pmani_020689 [Petrolisthes manimaculis]
MKGYNDSQTWEAWLGSLEVLWNNTSGIFVLSVLASVAVILATWAMKSHQRPHQHCHKQKTHMCDGGDEANTEDDTHTQHTAQEEDKLVDQSEKSTLGANDKRHVLETVQKSMTDQQRSEEREAQSQQLAAIFKMMQEQEEKFGETTIDDIRDQMKLYCG